MFIEPVPQPLSKLRRSAIFFFSEAYCAPSELEGSNYDVSYKHLAALRPGKVQRSRWAGNSIRGEKLCNYAGRMQFIAVVEKK